MVPWFAGSLTLLWYGLYQSQISGRLCERAGGSGNLCISLEEKYFSRIKVQEKKRKFLKTSDYIQEVPVFLYWKNEKPQKAVRQSI